MEMTCCTFELPVGVIGPIVPTLFQIVGPVLLVLGFTFIVAIPRWFLWFAYWLWCRHVPERLRHRTIPGIRSNVFQGVATREFVDEYSFSLPEQSDIRGRIVDYFRRHGAKTDEQGDALTFSRGSRLCTMIVPHIIPWRERHFAQSIDVRTTSTLKGQVDIHIRYVVQTLCMLRLQPAGLQDEVGELHRELTTTS